VARVADKLKRELLTTGRPLKTWAGLATAGRARFLHRLSSQ